MYCTKCGAANPDRAKFCKNCGAPIKARSFDKAATQVQTTAQASAITDNTSGIASALVDNIFGIIAAIAMVVLFIVFVMTMKTNASATIERLGAFDELAAGIGGALFMLCAVVPCFLALIAIISLLFPIRKTGDGTLGKRRSATDKVAFVPVIATFMVCAAIFAFSLIFKDPPANEISSALITVFSSYQTAAVVGTVISVIAAAVLILSGKSRKNI